MIPRTPPRVATWLLQHFGPGYRRDSLVGDLFEEYQRDRTRGWYWRQTAVAMLTGLRVRVPKFVLKAVLRALIELGVVVGGTALAASSLPHQHVAHHHVTDQHIEPPR